MESMKFDPKLQERLFTAAFPEVDSVRELSDEMRDLYGIEEVRFITRDGVSLSGTWREISDPVRAIESCCSYGEGLRKQEEVLGWPEEILRRLLSRCGGDADAVPEDEWRRVANNFREEFDEILAAVAKERNSFKRNRLGESKIDLLKHAFPEADSLDGLRKTMEKRLRENFSTDEFPKMHVEASLFKAPNGALDLGLFAGNDLFSLGTWNEMLECGIGIDSIVLSDEIDVEVSLLDEQGEPVSREALRKSFFHAADIVWSESHVQGKGNDGMEKEEFFLRDAQRRLFREAFPEFVSPRELLIGMKERYGLEILFNDEDGVSHLPAWEFVPEIRTIEAYWKDGDSSDRWETLAYPMEFIDGLRGEYSGKIENIQNDEWGGIGRDFRRDFDDALAALVREVSSSPALEEGPGDRF